MIAVLRPWIENGVIFALKSSTSFGERFSKIAAGMIFNKKQKKLPDFMGFLVKIGANDTSTEEFSVGFALVPRFANFSVLDQTVLRNIKSVKLQSLDQWN